MTGFKLRTSGVGSDRSTKTLPNDVGRYSTLLTSFEKFDPRRRLKKQTKFCLKHFGEKIETSLKNFYRISSMTSSSSSSSSSLRRGDYFPKSETRVPLWPQSVDLPHPYIHVLHVFGCVQRRQLRQEARHLVERGEE